MKLFHNFQVHAVMIDIKVNSALIDSMTLK